MAVDIDLAVRKAADGKWIRERLPARVPDETSFELAASPMILRGLAADDQIRLFDDGQFELLSWGRNIAVQVFGEWGEVDALAQHVASIGGRLDGKEPRVRVFTVPLHVGIYKIETTVENVVKDWPALNWTFGNLDHVDLLLGHDEAGEPLHEQVYAFAHPDGTFELVTAPLLVTGVASGDVVDIAGGGDFAVVQPSGNITVQAFGDWERPFVETQVQEAGGRLDAAAGEHVMAFTFPPDSVVADIEALFESESVDTDRTWRFGNLTAGA